MKFKNISSSLIVAVAFGGFAASCLFATNANAIPAFSRQFKKECITCHTIYPERNEYGEAFEKNGFVLPEGEDKHSHSDSKKSGFLDPLKEAGIPGQIPVSLWGQADMTYNKHNPDQTGHPQLDFDGGTSLDLMAAGNFLEKVSYWADYDFAGNSVGEVYAIFRHPYQVPVNIKVGKFEPKTSLWKSNNNFAISGFSHLSANVDNKVDSTAGTTQPNFSLDTAQAGIELSSVILPRLYVATGITNGINKKTNAKDWYGHVSTKIGGSDFKDKEPELDLDHISFLDYLSLTLGGYGYVGSSNDSTNHFYRYGMDTELSWKKATLKLGGVYGNDKQPRNLDTTIDALPTISKMGFVQGEYLINSSILASTRYEYQQIEHATVARRLIPAVAYTPVQNVKLVFEYITEKDSNADGSKTHNDQATARISFAF